ncbi:hypothetical protein NE237_022214 [Protea cynaroides]|uniref:Late embryogenesis abundant protein LEA-2 subgroup domain-containing protein n=1 Tax=Protea cynaroides TaxID=273540 RepID=A0A9Q0HCS1_9MAGN|nr:hypothetical protein NE237_022214 [Protea cynaroides]
MDSMSVKEDEPTRPLAPNPKKRNSLLVMWLLVFFGTLLFVFLLLMILGLTIFKGKEPTITVDSVTVKNLQYSLEPPPKIKAYLNATLLLDMSVYNPNKASFKYGNSSANIDYNGELVGEAMIPAGDIPSDGTVEIITTVTIMADRLLSDSNFYSDMVYGSIPFSVYTRISGKVKILIFKKHIDTHTSCYIALNIRTGNVTDTQCSSKVNL